ncbi:phosphate acyltransferase [Staphylococcus casei]|uniref:Phosphate acyltransferase n=1 Tax=Staphylococcus casei TaxID=201828 RepID=A0ABZ2WAX3_9STAP
MQYQHLIEHSETLDGNVAIIYANDEKMLSVVVSALTMTKIDVFLYDTQDPTEIIRSFDVDAQLLNRIHILTYEDEYHMFKACAEDLSRGKVNLLMKGNLKSSTMLSFILSNRNFISNRGFINHVACFNIPNYHKTLMLSDVALNHMPTVEEKKQIIKNLAKFSEDLGYQQFKVGLLSSVEIPSRKIPSSTDAEKIKYTFNRDNSTHLIVDGPLAFDNAISMESVIKKNVKSSVAGDVDALIVPHIDVGNALYKSFIYFGNASVASLVLGAKFPIVLTSRADSKQNKLESLLLALRVIS